MYKYLLIFLLFIGATQLRAQQYEKNFELENYKHTINYQDHKIVLHAQPIDKVLKFTDPDKKYYWYSNNQVKITQGGFSGKLLDGLYTDFYLNNNLKEQGKFKMGLKVGVWKTWSEQGLLLTQTTFKKGVLNGIFYKYDEQGKVTDSVRYKKGVLVQPVQKKGIFKRIFTSSTNK